MGKKKRNHPDVEEVLARPWCYYCERDFDDLKILISHQKAKHFKCEKCGRRLNTAGGLSVHLNQVHKEQLSSVDNAIESRGGLDVEIFGMEGIPDDVVQAHNQQVIQRFYEAQAERQAATGNPAPGVKDGQNGAKRPKFEGMSDLKKRLAEHRAKKSGEAAGGSSGDVTPSNLSHGNQSPAVENSPVVFPTAASPTFGQQPVQSGQVSHQQPAYSHPYGSTAYQQPGFPQPFPVPPVAGFPPAGFPPGQTPTFPPAGSPVYPTAGQQFPPLSLPLPIPPQGAAALLPTASSPLHAHYPGNNTPPVALPPGVPGVGQRQNSQTQNSNLPQRPAFDAPVVNNFQLQQMHHGQVPEIPRTQSASNTNGASQILSAPAPGMPQISATSLAVDELIASASKEVAKSEAAPTAGAGAEKKSKKDKEKNLRLVYSDNEVSPEEKMAQLPRYSFVAKVA